MEHSLPSRSSIAEKTDYAVGVRRRRLYGLSFNYGQSKRPKPNSKSLPVFSHFNPLIFTCSSIRPLKLFRGSVVVVNIGNDLVAFVYD